MENYVKGERELLMISLWRLGKYHKVYA